MVRQGTSATPSAASSGGVPEAVAAGTAAGAAPGGLPHPGASHHPGPYATETEGESRCSCRAVGWAHRSWHAGVVTRGAAQSRVAPAALLLPPAHPPATPFPPPSPPRLRDYLGARPEAADPLERLLLAQAPPPPGAEASVRSDEPDSTPQRVLRALENAPPSSVDPESAPPSGLKAPPPPGGRSSAQRPLSDSLTAAVRQLETGSPHQANGVAQYLATRWRWGVWGVWAAAAAAALPCSASLFAVVCTDGLHGRETCGHSLFKPPLPQSPAV